VYALRHCVEIVCLLLPDKNLLIGKAYAEQFTGKVSAVLAQSSGTQSDVSLYTVLIGLDKTQAKLLPGMTGQAEIELR
jgi:multidrug efflux pump subunit AcrA (membrane-fusion protein)